MGKDGEKKKELLGLVKKDS